jgi:hypothetical protein
MSAAKLSCFHCHKEIPLLGTVGRRDECPFCRADMHVCKNCLHYDPKAYNECHEPQADRVVEKERSNFCDYFTPGTGSDPASKKQDLLSAAEALFKKQ